MPRPNKKGLEYFPTWNIATHRNAKMGSANEKARYKMLRNSSSAFTKRNDVREYLLNKYDNKCAMCGATEKLQIDHIISVYRYAKDRSSNIKDLNREDNLQVLCYKCNGGKRP